MRRRHVHIICWRRLHSLGPVRIGVRRRTGPVARRFRGRRRITVQCLRQMLRCRTTRVLAGWRKVLIERRLALLLLLRTLLARLLLLLLPAHIVVAHQVRRMRRDCRVTARVVRRHHRRVGRLLTCRKGERERK